MLKTCMPMACATVLLSCGTPATKNNYEAVVDTDTTAAASDGINMAAPAVAMGEAHRDSNRKFIRTAELKFKVKDAARTTYYIEDITSRQGGFVTYTELKSETDHNTTTQVSADSSQQVTCYTMVNEMTLRIPNARLDTTLKLIAQSIDQLDYRTVKADDVALQMLGNDLAQRRLAASQQKLGAAIDRHGKKLAEAVTAGEALLQRQEQADEARIDNLSLADQVSYSTITLHLYQPQSIKLEMIANELPAKPYTPPFGSRLAAALVTGWDILLAMVLGIVNMWSIILLLTIAIVVYRHYRRREKASVNAPGIALPKQ